MHIDDQPEETTPVLTDEQRARMEEWLKAHPYGDQDENGIDLSLIRNNLKLTPTERYRRHQSALHFFLGVRRAGTRPRVL